MFANHLFKDKVVLVTGGGSGIGFAIAKMFLSYGAQVYIASRKADRIESALTELKQYGNAQGFVLDIREIEQVQAAAERIKKECGKCDILINNAGGQFPTAAEHIAPKGWNAVINNNLNGTWWMIQTFANQFFIPQKQGTIVNIIASIYRGFPGMAHTGAARAGVDNLTKSLAVEWAPHRIRINAVAPGFILSSGMDQYPPSLMEGIEKSVPAKRLGTPDEVAYLTLFLASDMAQYITGETVYVDGGQKLWGSLWQVPDFK